jgi:hypothetical protein
MPMPQAFSSAQPCAREIKQLLTTAGFIVGAFSSMPFGQLVIGPAGSGQSLHGFFRRLCNVANRQDDVLQRRCSGE